LVRAAAGSGIDFVAFARWAVLVLWTVCSGCSVFPRRGALDDNLIAGRALAQKGLDAIDRQRWDEAEDFLAEAVRRCPDDFRARYHYANVLWYRGARAAAIRQLELALGASQGADPQLQVRLGQMYLAQGQLDSAMRSAEQAIAEAPSDAGAWALNGEILHARGRMGEALSAFHRSLSCDTNNQDVQLRVAELYRATGRNHQALACLQRLAEQFEPGEEPQRVLYLQGLVCKSLGRYDDATEILMLASQRGQPSAEVLYELAEAELLAGRPTGARWAARQAHALAEDGRAAAALLSRIDQSEQAGLRR